MNSTKNHHKGYIARPKQKQKRIAEIRHTASGGLILTLRRSLEQVAIIAVEYSEQEAAKLKEMAEKLQTARIVHEIIFISPAEDQAETEKERSKHRLALLDELGRLEGYIRKVQAEIKATDFPGKQAVLRRQLVSFELEQRTLKAEIDKYLVSPAIALTP